MTPDLQTIDPEAIKADIEPKKDKIDTYKKSESEAQSESENDNNFNLSDLYKEPKSYFERQRNSRIKIENSPFSDLTLYENKLIGFSGIPGSSKTTICLNIIQDIIDSNPHYKAILFSLELNRETTVSKLAKVPVYFSKEATEAEAESYNKQDQEYIKNYLQSGKIGIIDRTADIKNDITAIGEILEAFKPDKEEKELESWQDLQDYRKSTEKEPKLLIFIDYFDIMRVNEALTGETDYKKEAYLIDNLKTFRDRYNFATFIIINSTNKTGLNSVQNQATIKGNSAIIFGYDQSFSLENIKKKVSDKTKDKHPHCETVNKFKFLSFDSSKLRENQNYKDENFYSDEGLIIIEDTKNRFSGTCTHFYKAIKGYSDFIKLDVKPDQETEKKKQVITDKKTERKAL